MVYFDLSSGKQQPKRNENFFKSKMYFDRGLKLAEEQHNISQIFTCKLTSSLGTLHAQHELFEEAIKYLDAAEIYAATCQDQRALCQSYAACCFAKCLIEELFNRPNLRRLSK